MYRHPLTSTHTDNQRGGIDEIKNINYSLNPVVQSSNEHALVPYRNKILAYLEPLISKTAESEISLEAIHNLHYKQVCKIIVGHYNFEAPQELNIQKMKETMGRSCFSQLMPSVTQSSMGGHNIDNY